MPKADGIALKQLADVGHDLHRPECVLCTSDGAVYVSDWQGGVCRIDADGSQSRLLGKNSPVEIQPNGIALLPGGSFLLANLGEDGGVWNLTADGTVSPVVTEVDGVALPPTNFVLADSDSRIWITVSTQQSPRVAAWRPDVADGFIVLVDAAGPRVIASDLGYTNEVQLHPSGEWLYVNETFAKRTSRMRINSDGSLGRRETVTEFGHGVFPDGLYFDEDGGFIVVSIVSNRVIRVAPDGTHETWIDDSIADHVNWVEDAFQNGSMDRTHLDSIKGKKLKNTSSIAFGGPDRRLSYLGCLLDERITCFRAPVAGVRPAHWDWRMEPSR